MNLKKIFWVVLAVSLLVWSGTIIYYLWPFKKPSVSTVSLTPFPTISSTIIEKDSTDIKKEDALSPYSMLLMYKGILESQKENEWTIKQKGGTVTFQIAPGTKFFEITLTPQGKKSEEITKEQIKLGVPLRVTIGIMGKERFDEEIEKGDLRNQSTTIVTLLSSLSEDK